MKKRLQYKIPVLGVLLILLLTVSATAGIGYSNLDNGKIKESVYSAIGDFLLDKADVAQDSGNGQLLAEKSILEPGTLMLFGLGVVGLFAIGRMRISN